MDNDLVVDFSVVGGGVGSCAVAKTESNPPVFFSLIVGGESCVLAMAESNPPDFVSVDLLPTVTLAVLGFAERIAILRIQCDFVVLCGSLPAVRKDRELIIEGAILVFALPFLSRRVTPYSKLSSSCSE